MDATLTKEWYYFENNHWWFIIRYRIFLGFIKNCLGNGSGYRILDLGCGAGKMIDLLKGFGNVYGLDISEDAIKFCRKRNIDSLIQADQQMLPLKPDSFDMVTAFDGIEHVEDDQARLRDYYKVCKPGGYLLLSVPAYQFLWGEHDVVANHKRRYTKKQLRNIVEKNGFRVERITYFNMLLLPAAIIFRYGKKLFTFSRKGISHDLHFTNKPIFRLLFYNIFKLEEKLLKYYDFPCGASIFCVARKSL